MPTSQCTLTRRSTLLIALIPAFRTLPGTSKPLETLSDWFRADSKNRESGVQECLKRIQAKDPSIHAWVQVLPQKATGAGKLSGIPFGAKDIIETKGLSTEFGSAVYKGRVGTSDAAVVRDLRGRGARSE